MKDFFVKWYAYNAWANDRVLRAMEKQDVHDESILRLFSHLLSAQFIWLNRIKGLPTEPFPLWQVYKLSELRTMTEDAAQNWNAFIESQKSFRHILKYRNYVGDYYENDVEQIMIHLVNHGSYHRGQIALLMRQKGYEPINTDYITYERVVTGQWQE
ncbi:MAG: hypothetical protein JNL17_12235 [Cyclobacteriaceae bacterium]|nr:hypothetical protein [Cyclobacteriaceae bacterium]